MRRIRLSTLMLLIVIAALVVALVVQHHRAADREYQVKREILEEYGIVSKTSNGRDVAKQEAARLRSVVESAKAKEGDEE